jgi:Tol biopolymer transport system component
MPDSRSVVVTGRDPSGPQEQLWQIMYPSGERHRVTTGLNDYGGVSVSSDGRTIATVEGESHANVFIYPVDGGPGRQITSHIRGGVSGGGIGWVPGKIVYASASGGDANQIWTMDEDGSHPIQLTRTKRFSALPRVAPDGQSVYYQGGDDKLYIWNIPVSGGAPRQVTTGPRDFRPIPSPDGKWVYYNAGQEDGRTIVMKIPVAGGSPAVVAPADHLFTAIEISPDGSRLLGTAWNAARSRSALAYVSVTDGALTWADDAPRGGGPIWLPGGKMWLYADRRKGVAGLFTRPVAGGEERKVVDLGDDQSWAVGVSPDGRNLAVVRGHVTEDVVLIKAK